MIKTLLRKYGRMTKDLLTLQKNRFKEGKEKDNSQEYM